MTDCLLGNMTSDLWCNLTLLKRIIRDCKDFADGFLFPGENTKVAERLPLYDLTLYFGHVFHVSCGQADTRGQPIIRIFHNQ